MNWNIPADPIGAIFYILSAVLVAAFGVGRLSRVATYDDYPPAMWIRQQVDKITHYDSEVSWRASWGKIIHCQWCFTPWLMAVCIGWALLSTLNSVFFWGWWIFWGWLAVSYLASIIIAHDEQA